MKQIVLAFILLSVSLAAPAEIEKSGQVCDRGLCLVWWPRLPPIEGWHHEAETSKENGINLVVPDGKTFSDAETVIYARAVYKPAAPETKSLDDLIAEDKKGFVENSPAATISEVEALATGDGQKLRSLTFFPQGEGNWERVSFGEEGEYYLMFTISSRTKSGYDMALPLYEAMLRAYKEKP